MSSLIIETELYMGPSELDPTVQEWAMEDAKMAWDACEKSVMKAYLYLLDQHTGERILVEAFE